MILRSCSSPRSGCSLNMQLCLSLSPVFEFPSNCSASSKQCRHNSFVRSFVRLRLAANSIGRRRSSPCGILIRVGHRGRERGMEREREPRQTWPCSKILPLAGGGGGGQPTRKSSLRTPSTANVKRWLRFKAEIKFSKPPEGADERTSDQFRIRPACVWRRLLTGPAIRMQLD